MKNATILMLEHDDDDRYITRTIFDENKCSAKLQFVSDSNEFIAHMKSYHPSELPSLIILNHYSVPLNAVELLHYLKSNSLYAHIPVIVLSGSKDDKMIRECYAAGASSFIQKPYSNQDTVNKMSTFIQYWFETAEVSSTFQ